jgi:hypothetical protein
MTCRPGVMSDSKAKVDNRHGDRGDVRVFILTYSPDDCGIQ